jgi:Beta-glucanase/Beta-glucan synthetase
MVSERKCVLQKWLADIEGKRERIKNERYDSLDERWQPQRKFAEYTAASLKTKDKFDFQYGILLVRAKIDTAMGLWPAIWTLGAERPWPSNGEIDLMEFYRWQNQATILANAAWLGDNDKALWDGAKFH